MCKVKRHPIKFAESEQTICHYTLHLAASVTLSLNTFGKVNSGLSILEAYELLASCAESPVSAFLKSCLYGGVDGD